MPGVLCEHCSGLCCRYIALPIETPESKADFDDVRWYLLHEGVSVFVEDGEWYISFQATCRHLQPDFRCGIYETRPRICREYSTDNCDYHSGDYGWSAHFTCPEHLDAYVRDRAAEAGAGAKRSKKGRRMRGGVKVKRRQDSKPGRGRPSYEQRVAELLAVRDVHRVPLPVLALEPAR